MAPRSRGPPSLLAGVTAAASPLAWLAPGAKRDPAGAQVEFEESVPFGFRDHPEREPLSSQGAHARDRSLLQPLQQLVARPGCRAREEAPVGPCTASRVDPLHGAIAVST